MEKRSIKEWIVRTCILLAGLTIAHSGVTLFLLSGLGADPFNVFVQGIFRSIGAAVPGGLVTHGRTYIKIGTVLCMAFGGPIIDFFTWMFQLTLPADIPLFTRILMLVSGCVILAFGMTIVIKSDAGTGPNDLVAVVLSDKLHRSFSVVRLLVDGAFAVIGFALGGTVGAGTIVCVALVGPVAGIFLPVSEKLVSRILACVSLPSGK